MFFYIPCYLARNLQMLYHVTIQKGTENGFLKGNNYKNIRIGQHYE